MYTDISYLAMKTEMDPISDFIAQMDLHLIGFGVWNETDIKGIKNFLLSNFQISYINEGVTKIECEDKEFICPSGSLFLFEPFKIYSAYSIGDENLKYSYLSFDVSPYSLRTKFEDVFIGNYGGAYSGKKFKYLQQMLENLSQDNYTPGIYVLVKVAVIRILVYMMEERLEKEPNFIGDTNIQIDKIVNDAIRYVDKNLDKPIQISKLASDIGVSESTLYKDFVSVFKISPSKFFTQYKIKKAEQLLRCKKYTLEEITDMLGYSSTFHFSKTFKNVLGRNPK